MNIDQVEPYRGGIRRPLCRYGRGCTHIYDSAHRERFSHPEVPALSEDTVRLCHICNECGLAFRDIQQLKFHLQRKSAWSNSSLLGCRISCLLLDVMEWHEGMVIHFHKAGKHVVEFKALGEKRLMNMLSMAFYIIERPIREAPATVEYKTDEDYSNVDENLAPLEDDWDYVEEISTHYAFAQSIIYKIYGCNVQETGHKTRGHAAVTEADKELSQSNSLLYGELLPRGANRAFSMSRLCVGNASSLFDLGCGTGKIVIQAFLQFPGLKYVYGVELSTGRYQLAYEAVMNLLSYLPRKYRIVDCPGRSVTLLELSSPSTASCEASETDYCRVLHIECGNMFEVTRNIEIADIVMLETDIPDGMHSSLAQLLGRMHPGARTLTYKDLHHIFPASSQQPLPFSQLYCNRSIIDRYSTSWSVQRGHHFYMWVKFPETDFQSTTSHTTHESSPAACGLEEDFMPGPGDREGGGREESSSASCLPIFALLGRLFQRQSRSPRGVNHDRSVLFINVHNECDGLSQQQLRSFHNYQLAISRVQYSQQQSQQQQLPEIEIIAARLGKEGIQQSVVDELSFLQPSSTKDKDKSSSSSSDSSSSPVIVSVGLPFHVSVNFR